MARLMEYYATVSGTNARQLRQRLDWLTREYLRAVAPRPGRLLELDLRSDRACELADAIFEAGYLLDSPTVDVPRSTRAAAVRHAEQLWAITRAELLRQRAYSDLRPRPARRPVPRAASAPCVVGIGLRRLDRTRILPRGASAAEPAEAATAASHFTTAGNERAGRAAARRQPI